MRSSRNVGIRLPNAAQMYSQLQANVWLVEYRGYGESMPSEAKPSEREMKADAEAVLRYVREYGNHNDRVDPSRVYVFGRSLGGAVGFHAAEHAERNDVPLAGLIVENAFTSIADMVDVLLPVLSPLKKLLLRIEWDNSRIASKLRKTPILYLAGENDEIVPHGQVKQLYEMSCKAHSDIDGKDGTANNVPKPRMHVIPGGTHNEAWMQGGQPYWDSMKQFLSETSSSSVNNDT